MSFSSRFSQKAVLVSIFGGLTSNTPIYAQEHDEHGEHGLAILNLTVEGNKVKVALESPSEDIYGLKSQAKNDAEKKKVEAAMETLKSKISEMIILESKLACKWTATDVQPWVVHDDPKHGGVHGNFDVDCSAPLSGSKMKFAFKKHFSTVNKIKVKVTSGGKVTSTEIKRDRGSVSL